MFFLTLRFIKTQTESVPGLSENAKLKRKNNNLVTMKYNVIINILTILSSLIFLIIKSYISVMVMLFVISCGSTLVYMMGIEEHRKKLLKSNLEATGKNKSNLEEVNQHPEIEPPRINNWIQ